MHSPAFRECVHAGLLAISSPTACSFPCGTADSDAAINSSVYSISSTIQNAGGLIADLLTTTILQVPATCPKRFGRFATLAAEVGGSRRYLELGSRSSGYVYCWFVAVTTVHTKHSFLLVGEEWMRLATLNPSSALIGQLWDALNARGDNCAD